MKTHTSDFKNRIKEFGREIDSIITYVQSGDTIELGNEELNSISPHYEGNILKSVMKQLDIDSNVAIPVGTELNYKFGVKARSGKNLLYNIATTQTINNVKFTVKEDKSIIINGTASAGFSFYLFDGIPFELDADNYTLSTNVSGTFTGNVGLYIRYNSESAKGVLLSAVSTVLNLNSAYTFNRAYIYVPNGASFTNVLVKPQLEQGTQATTYEAFGIYDYIDYGNYIVKEIEEQKDTRSYKITCYDKMLYAMKEYENTDIAYPITIRNYINALCTKMGITFANSSDTFANYDKIIPNELFLDTDGNSMNYTIRDVLDQLAQVTASTICINDDDELEIRYINQTIGKNLFTGFVKGIGISATNGSETTNDNNAASDFIPVNFTINPNYYLSGLASTIRSFVASYNSNKQFLGRSGATRQSGLLLKDSIFTGGTPQATGDIAYIRITQYAGSGSTESIDDIDDVNTQLEIGSSATAYEPLGDTIDEEYLKDVNVDFGEKYGPINTIILSRGGGGDNIYYPDPLPENPIEIKITDNLIMNDNNRDTYMQDIYNKLNGLEFYINDFSSTGICYYNLCDKYNVKIGNTYYSCIMFNDEVNITQGLEENVFTEMPEESETEYKYTSSTDLGITQANIIAKKNEATITEYTQRMDATNDRLTAVEQKQTDTDVTIDIISTNIDRTTGEVREITTTTGFTFNADGMTIEDSTSQFKALHRNDGTYYKDGDTIVGEYTKDGSKQKDLSLFGAYYYGMDDKDDIPMFVAQLYTDDNGEECFGHFYNRGD